MNKFAKWSNKTIFVYVRYSKLEVHKILIDGTEKMDETANTKQYPLPQNMQHCDNVDRVSDK